MDVCFGLTGGDFRMIDWVADELVFDVRTQRSLRMHMWLAEASRYCVSDQSPRGGVPAPGAGEPAGPDGRSGWASEWSIVT